MVVDPSTGRWLEDLVSGIGREDGQIRLEDGDRLVQRPRHATGVRSQEDVRVPARVEHPDVVHAGPDLPAVRGRDAEPKRGEVHRSAGRRTAALHGGKTEGTGWAGAASRRPYDRKDGDGGDHVHRSYGSHESPHDEEMEAWANELFGRRPMASIRQIAISAPPPKGCPPTLPQRSIRYGTFAKYRGGTSANFGRQAPRPPADFGRHGAVHDDRDGPAGEPPEDAPSGESEGRDVCGDGGGEARRHGGPRPPRERLPPRSGVWSGAGDQSVRPAGPHGPSRRPGAVRIREERELAGHGAPRRAERGERGTPRRPRG